MTNYKGVRRDYYFPFGQIYLFDLFYVVAIWQDNKLYFIRLETYLTDAMGYATTGAEFYANDDHVSATGEHYKIIRLSDLRDTGRAVRKSDSSY